MLYQSDTYVIIEELRIMHKKKKEEFNKRDNLKVTSEKQREADDWAQRGSSFGNNQQRLFARWGGSGIAVIGCL